MSSQALPSTDSNANLVVTWCNLALQVTETNSIIVISDLEFQSWSEHENNAILNEYYHLTATSGMFVRDSAIARIFLGPTVYFQQKNIFNVAGQLPVLFYDFADPNYLFALKGINGINNDPSTGPNSPVRANINGSPEPPKEKIPRPPNAFILYRKFHHPTIVSNNPGIHNNAVSTIIGKMWSSETPDVLAEWKVKAEQVKEEHARKYPGYHYQPRKPAEKKKRRSKKKLEAQTILNRKISKSVSASRSKVTSSLPPAHDQTSISDDKDIELQNTQPLSDEEFSQFLDEINMPENTRLSNNMQYPVFQEAERQIAAMPGLTAQMDNAIDTLDEAGMPGVAAYRQDMHDLLNSVETDVLSFGPKLANQALNNGWMQ